MAERDQQTVEEKVLVSLAQSDHALNLADVVAQVKNLDVHNDMRVVDIKIAALNLVSSGRATMNDEWQISAVRRNVNE